MDKPNFDGIVLAGTSGSGWKCLCEKIGKEEINTDYSELDKDDALKKKLEDYLSENLDNIPVKVILIKNGVTEKEIGENFCKLKNEIKVLIDDGLSSGINTKETGKDQINIAFDISNGFRSFPMLIYATINYISAIETKYDFSFSIYYGMYDSKLIKLKETGSDIDIFKLAVTNEEKRDDKAVAPFVNMTDVSIVIQWASAVNEFYSSGSIKQIINLLSRHGQNVFRENVKDDIISAFEKFNFAVNSNNLNYFAEAVKVIITARDCLSENAPWYASDIIEYITKDFKQRFYTAVSQKDGNIKYGELTLAVAKWYCDQSRYGDAAIALQEGIITYVLEEFNDECVQFINKKITRRVLSTTNEVLFDIDTRELIRKYIFETKDDFWTDKYWDKYYREICANLRNPAMKLYYNESEPDNVNVTMIEKAVLHCVDCMQKGRIDEDIKKKLGLLINKKEYDVFISYRRTYSVESDGVLIANSIFNYLERKGYKVFLDKDGLSDKTGDFNNKIQEGIANSEFLLIILGEGALDRSFKNKIGKTDVFYNEILYADQCFKKESENHIFVCCMQGFGEENELSKDINVNEEDKCNIDRIQKIAYDYERVGARGSDIWKYEALPMLEDEIVKLLRKKKNSMGEGSTFVNYTNHSSSTWCNKQRQEAEKYGVICDVSFANVLPLSSAVYVESLAERELERILGYNPACVLCQGEFTLSYYLINKLKKAGVKVVAACTERNVREEIHNGETINVSKFVFKQFREY